MLQRSAKKKLTDFSRLDLVHCGNTKFKLEIGFEQNNATACL
jgi:hypothetical protein